MKIYTVKKISHLDYLTSHQAQSISARIVYSDVGEEDGWMHRIFVDDKGRVWVRWVAIGQSTGFDSELLTGLRAGIKFYIVGEKLFVYECGEWFGWKQFKSLIKQAKYGKNSINKQNFYPIELQADILKNKMILRQVFKFNKDIYALFSQDRGFALKNISESSSQQFKISLQNFNLDDGYCLEDLAIDKQLHKRSQSSQLFLCLVVKRKCIPVQKTILIVSLKIYEQQMEMVFQIVHQFIEMEEASHRKSSKLNMSIMGNKFLISFNRLFVVGQDFSTKWIIQRQEDIESCSIIEDHKGEHIIVIICQKRFLLQVYLYNIQQIFSFCQLSPTLLQIDLSKQESFVGIIPLFKEGRPTEVLINLTSTNYLLSYPMLSMVKILQNNKRDQQQIEESQEEDLFMSKVSQACENNFIGMKLQDFQKLVDSKNISFNNALKQLTAPKQILNNIERLCVDSNFCSLHFWIKMLEFTREYTTIFLYLNNFIANIKQNRTSTNVVLPSNIKQLLKLCRNSQQNSFLDQGISIEIQYYNSIITCLRQMRQAVILLSCLLCDDGNSQCCYEISTSKLVHHRILLELGLQNIIHFMLNPNKLVTYLIYNMCISMRTQSLEQMLQYQRLLRDILSKFTDYHPLAYLLANINEQYLFNSVHFNNCLELIDSEKKENQQNFEGIVFIDSVYIKFQSYLKRNNLSRFTVLCRQQKLQINQLAIPIFHVRMNQNSERQIICEKIEDQEVMLVGNNRYYILNQRQVLHMVDFMNNYKAIPQLLHVIKDKIFIFGQILQNLNSQLLLTLKILYQQAAKIRQYNNLQFKQYSCKMIPNQQYRMLFNQNTGKKQRRYILELEYSTVQTVVSSYIRELHRICCSFRLKSIIQFVSAFLPQANLQQQQIEDCSFIPHDDSRINNFNCSIDLQGMEPEEEKDYVLRMKDAFQRLLENLSGEYQYEVEEEVSCTIFTNFIIKLRRHLLNIIINEGSFEKNIFIKRDKESYEKLFKIASSQNKHKICLKKQEGNHNQLLIQFEHKQNLLEICSKYRLSCFNETIHQIQQLISSLYLLRESKLDETDYAGLYSAAELIQIEYQ